MLQSVPAVSLVIDVNNLTNLKFSSFLNPLQTNFEQDRHVVPICSAVRVHFVLVALWVSLAGFVVDSS